MAGTSLMELERTPGAAAVSGTYGRAPVGDTPLPASLATNSSLPPSLPPQTDSRPYVHYWTSKGADNLKVARLIGYGKLKNLLQPKHKYFEGEYAEVWKWYRYLDKQGNDLLYPKVKTFGRNNNPYRKHQLNSQCAARSAKKVFRLKEQYQLHGLRMIDITLTHPKAVSNYLAARVEPGRDAAWSLGERFWSDMVEHGLIGAGHARHSNLHTWSSREPLEAHFHTHNLIPNYEVKNYSYKSLEPEDFPKYPCSKCGGTLWLKTGLVAYQCAKCFPVDEKKEPEFIKREWCYQAGTMVPWSYKQLVMMKALWLNTNINYVRRYCIEGAWGNQVKLLRFQRRRGIAGLVRLISFLARFDKGLIDVSVSFINLNSDIGRAKFMHKLAYNGRHPVEDYAVYSNEHTDCVDPPEWLLHYENKARPFGWWRDIGELVKLSGKEEKIKLSPYDSTPMEYLGKVDTLDLLNGEVSGGNLVAVDFIRGSPVERLLDKEELSWLYGVDFQRSLYGTSYEEYMDSF